jgi:hypothetical protein
MEMRITSYTRARRWRGHGARQASDDRMRREERRARRANARGAAPLAEASREHQVRDSANEQAWPDGSERRVPPQLDKFHRW